MTVKANSVLMQQPRQGGANLGHPGQGRGRLTVAQADERQVLACEKERCPSYQAPLLPPMATTRAVYDYEAEKIKKGLYELAHKRCPRCRRTVPAVVTEVCLMSCCRIGCWSVWIGIIMQQLAVRTWQDFFIKQAVHCVTRHKIVRCLLTKTMRSAQFGRPY